MMMIPSINHFTYGYLRLANKAGSNQKDITYGAHFQGYTKSVQ